MVLPSWAGDMLTTTPADWRAAIFSLAPPFPPAMMAPAWPILRPGGAVSPAMKDTTGFALAPWKQRETERNMREMWQRKMVEKENMLEGKFEESLLEKEEAVKTKEARK